MLNMIQNLNMTFTMKMSTITKVRHCSPLTSDPLDVKGKQTEHVKSVAYNDLDTDFMFAAIHGNVKLISTSLSMGANIEVRNSMGETPVMVAAKFSNTDCMFVLIKSGANLDTMSHGGDTVTRLLDMNHIRSRSIQGLHVT